MLDRIDAPPSDYVAAMLDEINGLVATLRATTPSRDMIDAARLAVLQATLQLDGTQVDTARIAAVEREHPPQPRTDTAGSDDRHEVTPHPLDATATHGSWLTALQTAATPVDDATTALLEEREIVGAAAAFDADDLADSLQHDMQAALGALHARLVAGLVAPDRIGAPRTTDQAVLDTSVGRVLYFPVDACAITAELSQLARWMESTRAPAVITAGIVHLELLRIHPFDAANGRLARAAARLLLRAGGVDPFRLAQPEVALAEAPLTYHEKVAAALRRGNPDRWLDYWADIVAGGLRRSAALIGAATADVPDRANDFVRGLTAADSTAPVPFTLADYRDTVGVSVAVARTETAALVVAGYADRLPGTLGLRMVTAAPTDQGHELGDKDP